MIFTTVTILATTLYILWQKGASNNITEDFNFFFKSPIIVIMNRQLSFGFFFNFCNCFRYICNIFNYIFLCVFYVYSILDAKFRQSYHMDFCFPIKAYILCSLIFQSYFCLFCCLFSVLRPNITFPLPHFMQLLQLSQAKLNPCIN